MSQSSVIVRPPAAQSALVTRPLALFGGLGAVVMKPITVVDQGSSDLVEPAADSNDFVEAGTGWDAVNGRTRIRWGTGNVTADGAEEGVAFWTRALLDEQPDFDPAKHALVLEFQKGMIPSGTLEASFFFGLFQGTIAAAGVDGIAGIFSNGSLSADNAGYFNAITSTFVGGGDNLDAVRLVIFFTPLSGAYEIRALGHAFRQDGTLDAGPASWSEISTLPGDPSNWDLGFGPFSRSTDAKQTITMYGARVLTGLIELPELWMGRAPARQAKTTSGIIRVVIFGDSIADGVGGSTGGGAALPAGVLLWVDGASQTNWPLDAGIMPQLAADLLAQGYTEVHLFQRALTSQYIEVTVGQYLAEACSTALDQGVAPGVEYDLVVTMIGTNDGNGTRTPTQVASFKPQLRNACRRSEWASFRSRWIHLSPLAAVATHADINTIRGHIAAVMAEEADRRVYVDCSDLARADNAHPTAGSYNTMGSRAAAAWASMP